VARQRNIRDEAPLPDDATLVRALFDAHAGGTAFDRVVLIADATRNFELFGYYGLSLWATSAEWPVDRVLAQKSQKAARAALFTAGDLRDKGLGLVPSGRAPHYDTTVGDIYGRTFGSVQITAPSADDLIDRFVSATYTLVENHHYKTDAG
jgi:hypothetical protein